MRKLHTFLTLQLAFCFANACLAQINNDNFLIGNRTGKALVQNGVYKGKILTDSMIYGNQFSFVNRDTALFFLDSVASTLTEVPCATFYRVAPLTKYYQFDGQVMDYYLDNDSVAARLLYSAGVLNGPCVFYYRNGQVRDSGAYSNNERIGIWDYYFENGQKAKTIRFTDSSTFLIDCFTPTGEVLAKDGNGRFEGNVLIGNESVIEYNMKGPVMNGRPEGEWKLFTESRSHPANVEQFSDGNFIHGISNSTRLGSQEYNQYPISRVDGVHPVERLDYYALNTWCSYAGKHLTLPPYNVMMRDLYGEIDRRVKRILSSTPGYSGWIVLDIRYSASGKIIGKSVRLYQQNEPLRQQLLDMLDRLSFPGKVILDGKDTPFEKLYVVLADGKEVVIPEELLSKQRVKGFLGR